MYKNLMARQYDVMVKPRHFNIRDLVLKGPLQQPETRLMGNQGLIRKDPTELLIVRDKDLTTWKPWMEESWSTPDILCI